MTQMHQISQYRSSMLYKIWKAKEKRKFQDYLRRLVKGVISCDILRDPPLLVPGYEGPYDIIFSTLCLTAACTTHEEYSQSINL